MSVEQNPTTISYDSNKSDETPFVNKLIDENTNLKQQILVLSADLRALKVKPGSAEHFTEEIEALSSAIKSLRAMTDAQNIEAARRKISATIDLHVQTQNDNADLPSSSPSATAAKTRIQSLEDSLLTETERRALRLQRERIKKSIEENLGGANRIDELVEEEMQKKRREKLSRQLELESFARGANVLNFSSSTVNTTSSPSSLSSIGNNNNDSPLRRSLLLNSTSSIHQSPVTPITSSPSSVSRNLTNNNANGNVGTSTANIISPIRVPRKALPTDEEYKQMIAEEDRILSAQRDANNRRIAEEEAARNESLHSVLSNPRNFSVPREREEKQQMIIGNSTPLRAALVKAQQDAFNLLKRDLEAVDDEAKEAGDSGSERQQASAEEYRRRTEERLLALQDLEKHHKEMLHRGNCAAAALSV